MKAPAAAFALVVVCGVYGFSSQPSGNGVGLRQPISRAELSNIVQKFPQDTFVAPKGLGGNQHWQTIVGSGALRKILLGQELQRGFSVHSVRCFTPDKDEFEVEFVAGVEGRGFEEEDLLDINSASVSPSRSSDDRPIVVMLHGLEANAKGNLMTKMCEAFTERGFACVLVSFRGCNGSDNKTVGAYHLGFTQDVDQLTLFLQKKYPRRRIYLSGFSLGGNVALKFLGELGGKARDRNILGAVTMSVPYDLVESGARIDKGINRILYANNFLSTLKEKAERQHKSFPGVFDIEAIRKCSTMGEFDNEFIAKIYKFDGKDDYYRQSQAKGWLREIQEPCICINAIDDPFIEPASLPGKEDVRGAPVKLIFHDQGGHCGFVDVKGDDRWIAKELARALDHIHTYTP